MGREGERASKGAEVDSSISERPEHRHPRRLADWINPSGERKIHSLIEKVLRSRCEVATSSGSEHEPCRSDSFHRIPPLAGVFVKAGCGKSARPV